MRIVFLIILLVVSVTSSAQPYDDIVNLIELKMDSVRAGMPIDEQIRYVCNSKNFSSNKAILLSYVNDTMPAVRKQAYRYLSITALKSNNIEDRQIVVNALISSCFSEESGNTYSLLQYLKRFDISDFTSSSLYNLDSLLNCGRYYKDDIYKIAAYASSPNANFILNNKLELATTDSEKWSMYISLARMGDENAISFIESKIIERSINTNFVLNMIPDLIFTRQHKIYDILFKWILTDEYICITSNPDNEQEVSCAYFVVELMVSEVVDFPAETDEFGELDEEITQMMLQDVRDWYGSIDTYAIRTDKY